MSFLDLANRRYSVRTYKNTPIPQENINRCIEAARLAPSACNSQPWKFIIVDDPELMNELAPVLRSDETDNTRDPERWASRLIKECRQAISIVLPFREGELEFLDCILDRGEIEPYLITTEKEMANKIQNHPGLQWKALNVRKFKGIE